MRHRLVVVVVVAAMAAVGLPGAASSQAPPERGRLAVERQRVLLDDVGLTDLRDEVDLFLYLTEPAVAEFVADEVARGRAAPPVQARRAHAQRVQRQHDRVRRHLARLDVHEHAGLKTAVNGLRVRAVVEQIPELRAIPEVAQVVPVALYEPANATSVPWIGAPAAQETIGGSGDGVTIAVIDTGVDYTHRSMGGSGDTAEYDAILEDTTVVPDVDGVPAFPTAKVVAGFDFAGTDYDARGVEGSPVPQPDPNPIDVGGHGTHVAATAAGVEVRDADGHVRVGAGVAPDALVYALKVFGDTAGSSAVVPDAIEWAVDPLGDGSMQGQADVINMSLGRGFGPPDDPSAVAAQNATEVGTVVVASAGNSGHDAAYVTGSPAVAAGAISVAASVDGGFDVTAIEVQEPASVAGLYEAVEGFISVPLEQVGPITDQLVVADPLLACDEIHNPQEMAGKIALVERGECLFATKHLMVQEAGAVAIVVVNNEAGRPMVMGGDPTGIEIPGVMVTRADGALLKGVLDDGGTVTATLSAELRLPRPDLADTLAEFTSRGPGSGSVFKPEVAAPGVGIDSAAVATGDRARRLSGTSMAAPHVTGVAALLAQQHGLPDLEDRREAAETVQTIKSLIVNTATPAAGDYPLALQGTGVVRANRAATTDVVTTPAALSFGRLNPLAATSVTETLTVTNLGDVTRTFAVSFAPFQQPAGVTVTHDALLTAPAGGTALLDVTVSLDPAEMAADDAFFSHTEADGWLLLDDGETELRVGLLAVVDPAAAVAVETLPAARGPGGQLTLGNPSATAGFAYGFTLVQEGDGIGGVTEALGVRTDTFGAFDVVQLGIATDAWDSLSGRSTQVLLNTDAPGSAFDFVLVAADLGFLLGQPPFGVVATALFDLTTGEGLLQWLVDGDYNDRVHVLTVDRRLPTGFLDGNQRFEYLALTFDRGALVGLQEGLVDLRQDADGMLNPLVSAPAGFDGVLTEYPRQDRRRMLWLYPNNQHGAQFGVLRLG